VRLADGIVVAPDPPPIEQPTLDGWKEGQAERSSALILPPPARDTTLPYDYYYVKEPAVPEYHRLPSRNEQRAALAFSERYQTLLAQNEQQAARLLAGELGMDPVTVVSRYLERGFYVASPLVEQRASRLFVRTTQGRYIKQAQLEPRSAHAFRGVTLDGERNLPVAWVIRTTRPLLKREREGGSIDFVEDAEADPIERKTLLDGWRGRSNLGGQVVHQIDEHHYLRDWFATIAERIDRPTGVGAEEPWVHVDLSAQTLVLYRGDDPIYATLVSSGVEGHATPTGTFEIRRKLITDTMSDIGADASDDRYRIEDVPWTQYFEGSFALHAAFWHTGFGLPRSHGCINLAPEDARHVFSQTWPTVPDGWHGISADAGRGGRRSHVVISE
jgi:hypothetical protein